MQILTQNIESFFGDFPLLHYKKGTPVLRAYEPPPGVFCIKKGYAKLYSISKQGEELTLMTLQPGDCFPLAWALANIPSKYNIDAMTDLEVWKAPENKFVYFLKTQPEVLLELTKRILGRNMGLFSRMEQLVFGHASAKIASILCLWARRFGIKEDEGIVIPIPITHKDIASFVGLARETTSLEVKKLEERGLISHKKGLIIIKDLERLEQESVVTDNQD